MRKAAAPIEPNSNVIPLVAPRRTSDRTVWIAGAVLAMVAVILFLQLDGRRRALNAPATTIPSERSDGLISAPPELAIPDQSHGEAELAGRPPVFGIRGPGFQRAWPRGTAAATPARSFAAPAPNPYGRAVSQSPSVPPRSEPPYPQPVFEQPAAYEPGGSLGPSEGAVQGEQQGAAPKDRVYAARLTNPSTTVPLGTVIPAVLETALDSTRPGAVRAIVSRDVRGFDGSRILIPRGSRLYGEYGAELAPGQNRALIRWSRLIRPDGAIIALDSPASDTLGRAGVQGSVDSRFLERFGEALLQSTLDIGAGLASRRIGGSAVIFAMPGSNPQVSTRAGQQVQRTLKVRHGSSVSVFVARDLDFTPVEN